MSSHEVDLFVIGAGSGGVRAARIAAGHGARVAVAEEHKVGGTCVIRGCVPKKLLVYGAHFAEDLDDAAMFGWDVPSKRFDWPVLRDNVPNAVFSHPPIAGVGLTEGEARNTLGQVKVFTSDFRPMKNVLAGRNERSLYKLVVDAATDRVVGIHMIGPDAPEILQAAAVAVKAGLKKADFDNTIALHPTMSEELVLMR